MSLIPEAARVLVGGWATAGKALVAPVIGWVYAALAVAVLAGVGWGVWRIMSWHTGYEEREAAVAALAAEKACEDGTACAAMVAKMQADGSAAVETARKAAQEAADAQAAKLAADGQAAVDRATAAASVARVRQREAEARLRNAIATDVSCAAQAREPIRCDY